MMAPEDTIEGMNLTYEDTSEGTQAAKKAVARKMLQAMKLVGYVQKKGRNAFHKYSYVQEADVMEKVHAACLEVGLYPMPSCVSSEIIPHKNAKGEPTFLTKVRMAYEWVDADTGLSISVYMDGQGMDNQDKGFYKGCTGANKYMFMKALMVSSGDDPENDQPESGITPTSEAIAPNTLIDGVVLDYEPKEGEKPHKIRVGLADGDITFTQHRLPCSEALLANCLGAQVKLAYRKQGKFMELTEIQPHMAQTAIETPEAPQDMDGWEGGTIKAYGTKSGETKDGRPWTSHKFDFLTTEGRKVSASTFSLSDIGWEPDQIYMAIEAQTDVRFLLEANGKFWNVMALELVDGEG